MTTTSVTHAQQTLIMMEFVTILTLALTLTVIVMEKDPMTLALLTFVSPEMLELEHVATIPTALMLTMTMSAMTGQLNVLTLTTMELDVEMSAMTERIS